MSWQSQSSKQKSETANLEVRVCFKKETNSETSQLELLLENHGDKTRIVTAGFLFTNAQDSSFKELRNLENLEMLHGQRSSLAITISPEMFQNVLAGREKLILEYQIRYLGPRSNLTEREGSYEYEWEEGVWKGGDFGAECFSRRQ